MKERRKNHRAKNIMSAHLLRRAAITSCLSGSLMITSAFKDEMKVRKMKTAGMDGSRGFSRDKVWGGLDMSGPERRTPIMKA